MTQQQVAKHLGIARTTIVAVEKGRRCLKPRELAELASFLALNFSELLQGVGRAPGFAEYQPPDEPLSDRYIALAVEAWDQGVLSEGQLARLLRTTRLGAREIVQRLLPVDFPPHD